jgi:hypothetical protein
MNSTAAKLLQAAAGFVRTASAYRETLIPLATTRTFGVGAAHAISQ